MASPSSFAWWLCSRVARAQLSVHDCLLSWWEMMLPALAWGGDPVVLGSRHCQSSLLESFAFWQALYVRKGCQGSSPANPAFGSGRWINAYAGDNLLPNRPGHHADDETRTPAWAASWSTTAKRTTSKRRSITRRFTIQRSTKINGKKHGPA